MKDVFYEGEVFVTYHAVSGVIRWFTTDRRIGFENVGVVDDAQAVKEAEAIATGLNMDLFFQIEDD